MPQPKQKPKPKIKKHGKITMTQTGTPKYIRKAEEKRLKIEAWVNFYTIVISLKKLHLEQIAYIYAEITRMLKEQEKRT